RGSLNKEYNLLMNSTIEHKGLYELINDKLNQIRKAEYDLDEFFFFYIFILCLKVSRIIMIIF
ncbi:hypothetical protein J8791_28190, partial [Klebsiella pneumoniae]